MYTYKPTDNDHIHIYGRTVKQDPLPLFWTASGVEFNTDATEAWIELECDYSNKEIWVRVEVDGFMIQRFMPEKGRKKYCLFRGFGVGQLKTIGFILEAQPMEDDEERKLLIHEISCDCLIQPVEEKSHKIEFIGDSITSGEGLTGTQAITDWFTAIYGLEGHYARTVAKHFDADYSIVSQSGWGVYSGWDNNMNSVIPRIYDKVCGVVKGDTNEALGASRDNDFEAWEPEVIVINLATNDGGACNSDAWTDPDTGIVYKQKLDASEKPDEPSKEHFETAMMAFLKQVRSHNKTARIVWVYGMIGYLMQDCILETIDAYKAETGDNNIEYISLPENKPEQLGSHGHPGYQDHQDTAKVIIERLEKILL